MAFPNIFKGNKKQNNAPTGWENMAAENQNSQGQSQEVGAESQLSPEQQNIRRQQNKLIAYFVTGDIRNMSASSVEVSQAAEERYFENILNGSITKEQENHLITSILSPIDIKIHKGQTREGALRSIYQELGMQNYFIARAVNSNGNDEQSGIDNIQTFTEAFPLPSDFDKTEASLKQTLKSEGYFSDQQVDNCLRSVRESIYGKRQQYQDRINELHSAAQDYAIQKNLRWQQGAEIERNPGFTVGSFGISKRELQTGQTLSFDGETSQNYEQFSQDSYYINKESGVFAVFDGVGGSEFGMTASRVCRDTMPSRIINNTNDILQTLVDINKNVCNACGNIKNTPPRGATTATIVKLSEDHRTLSCASIGDSRAYLIRDGKAELLTKDDGEGNKISKYIGDLTFEEINRVSQENVITRSVMPGDRILLCTDGITGDYAPDLMSNETIANVVSKNTPEDAATFLTQIATKTDDRTAIVIEV